MEQSDPNDLAFGAEPILLRYGGGDSDDPLYAGYGPAALRFQLPGILFDATQSTDQELKEYCNYWRGVYEWRYELAIVTTERRYIQIARPAPDLWLNPAWRQAIERAGGWDWRKKIPSTKPGFPAGFDRNAFERCLDSGLTADQIFDNLVQLKADDLARGIATLPGVRPNGTITMSETRASFTAQGNKWVPIGSGEQSVSRFDEPEQPAGQRPKRMIEIEEDPE